MDRPSVSDPLSQKVEIKIKPSQVAIAGLALLAVLGVALLVLRLIDVLIMAFVALVIAITLRPMVSALHHRGIPKVLALLLIYLGMLGVLAGMFFLVIPVLIDQGGALLRGLPQMYAGLVASLAANPSDAIHTLSQLLPTGDQLASQLQAVSGVIVTGALGIGMGVIAFLTQIVSIVALSIYLTLGQSRLERFWLSLAPPAWRPQLLSVWREIESHLSGYVRGEILLMASIGVLAGLGYWLIGLPFPLALGAFAGLLEFVPMVGPTLGAVPAVLVALTISPHTALVVVVYSIVIQVAENNFLVPRLMGHSVGVSPVVVIIAIFAFSSLLGIIGAFLAVPLAAILQVLMDHLVVNAGVVSTEEPDEDTDNIIVKMRAQVRRMRADVLQQLRARRGRITMTTGDPDDIAHQADHLLHKADQALTKAAQTEGTDTAVLAEVDQAINQAGEMVEEVKAEAVIQRESADLPLVEVDPTVKSAGKIAEKAKAGAVAEREHKKTH